jgi:hypothetical protein
MTSPIRRSVEYKSIAREYGERRAERSQVLLIKHIDEGITILEAIDASETAIRAFCLHPLIQDDASYAQNMPRIHDLTDDMTVLATAMEYRRVANAALSHREYKSAADIALSEVRDVNEMLIADKVQNRKDFLLYHLDRHERSADLDRYFRLWLERLGIDEARYAELVAKLA